MKIKEPKRNYIDKTEFLEAMRSYAVQCHNAKDAGEDRPPVPKYIGESIWAIAKGVAMRGNFSNYPFRDDMIMDGVENCLKYMHNFDPTKSDNPNPFGYFTKIIWYAFLRRIAEEKEQMYIRYKSSSEMLMMGMTYDSDELLDMSGMPNLEYINDFIKEYEEKLEEKKKKKNKKKDEVSQQQTTQV